MHYLRWIRPANPNQVILEVAFWLGPSPGVAPTTAMLTQYGDVTHTGAGYPDRWVVFHFHIPLDRATFQYQNNWYPGVETVSVYHSGTVMQPEAETYEPGFEAEYRAEWRLANSADIAFNTPYTGLRNYNARTQPVACDRSDSDYRWYVGIDRTGAIDSVPRPEGFSQLMNRFVSAHLPR